MRLRTVLALGAALLAAGFFAWQIHRVFALRLETGGAYAPYSTYRADPKGARALYGSLARMDRVSVRRNEQRFALFEGGAGTTLFILGALHSRDPKGAIEALEAFVQRGGRLVVAFRPGGSVFEESHFEDALSEEGERESEGEPPAGEGEGEVPAEGEPAEGAEGETVTERESTGRAGPATAEDEQTEGEREGEIPEAFAYLREVNIAKRWGWSYEIAGEVGDQGFLEERAEARRQVAVDWLPATLPWWSPIHFGALDDLWQVIYARADSNGSDSAEVSDGAGVLRPVVIERKWGKGSLVLISDSYLFSNEGLRKDRYPAFLAWAVGANRNVVIDETTKGVSAEPGIVELMYRYRLHGVLLAFVLAGGLFVWQCAMPLARRRPASYEHEAAVVETQQDSMAGLVNLLRREIPRRRLLRACYTEWLHSFSRDRRFPAKKQNALNDLVQQTEAEDADPAAQYEAACRIVNERM